jgi:predicted permease
MGHFRQDFRFAIRMLFKNPLFTSAAVLTLALGIGMNAAVFSAVHALLFRPLPQVREDTELVQLYRSWPGDVLYGSNSVPHYQDIRDRVEAFDGRVAAWTFVTLSLAADGRSERLLGNMVSANYFDVLGTVPALGRGFLPEEARDPGGHPVVVLGHSFWLTRFGGDPSIVGRDINMNGRPFTVVGVAPEGFRGTLPILDPPIYAPLMMQRELLPGFDFIEARGNNWLNVVARLAPGATVERARESLDAFLLQVGEEFPDHYDDSGIHMVPQTEAGIHPQMRNAQVGMSAVTMVVVGFLLLIACINVANLFLVRASERRREMGIRLSLGARRGRLVAQLLTESLLFSILAGGVGLILAYWAIGFVNTLTLPIDFPVSFDLEMNRPVLGFTLGVALLTGLLFGLVPALQASNPETVTALKGDSGLSRRGGLRVAGWLVVAQTALSVVLLITSGLFVRGLQAATQVDKGFEEENLLLASVDPGLQGYDRPRAEAFYDQLRGRLEALPGVQAVSFAARVPLSLTGSDRGVEIPGYEPSPDESMSISYNQVGAGYFRAMAIPILAGREFGSEDTAESPAVLVVNERFADRFWPGEDAVGKTLVTGGIERTVVGIAKTGKYSTLGEDPTAYMYFPQSQLWTFGMTVHLRTSGSPTELAPLVREEVRELDPLMPVADLRTMTNALGIILFPARLGGITLGLFGVLGMILAAVGIYGVMAYSVTRQTRDIGIRVALGAGRGQVLSMVVRHGMTLVGLGIVLGLAAAAGVSTLTAGVLYGVEGMEPVTFLGVPALLAAVALLAIVVPARRAASVEPMRALRSD